MAESNRNHLPFKSPMQRSTTERTAVHITASVVAHYTKQYYIHILHLGNRTSLQIAFWCWPVQLLCKGTWCIYYSKKWCHPTPWAWPGSGQLRISLICPQASAETSPSLKTRLLSIPVDGRGWQGSPACPTQGPVQHTIRREQLLEIHWRISQSSSWTRKPVRSLKTRSRLNCAIAISSSNAKAAIVSFGTAITHGYSLYIVTF